MNTLMHGRSIDCIWFHGGVGNASGNPERIKADGKYTLDLSATHHGDHDEFWIIQRREGREVARYKASHVDAIEWTVTSEPLPYCDRCFLKAWDGTQRHTEECPLNGSAKE